MHNFLILFINTMFLTHTKVYFDLLEARKAHGVQDVALIRLEQIYPFPIEEYAAQLKQYAHVKDRIWCQEEPQNQGAWYQIRHRLQQAMTDEQQLFYAGRASAAAPASGIFKVHLQQQQALVEAALGIETKASKSANTNLGQSESEKKKGGNLNCEQNNLDSFGSIRDSAGEEFVPADMCLVNSDLKKKRKTSGFEGDFEEPDDSYGKSCSSRHANAKANSNTSQSESECENSGQQFARLCDSRLSHAQLLFSYLINNVKAKGEYSFLFPGTDEEMILAKMCLDNCEEFMLFATR